MRFGPSRKTFSWVVLFFLWKEEFKFFKRKCVQIKTVYRKNLVGEKLWTNNSFHGSRACWHNCDSLTGSLAEMYISREKTDLWLCWKPGLDFILVFWWNTGLLLYFRLYILKRNKKRRMSIVVEKAYGGCFSKNGALKVKLMILCETLN